MFIQRYINITADSLIIEPSAGNGAFIEYLKLLSTNIKCYDLEPEHIDIIQQDFLTLDCAIFKQQYTNIHIVGNPPFGRQSSMAIKFIKKCCEFATSISFILPKSFKKDSMRKHFTNHFHLIFEIDLLDNSFLVNNIECNVPYVFQIWQYQTEIRNIINKIEPLHFKFVDKQDNPNISFRRVGVNAGKISDIIDNKSIQSHYFIKFTNASTIIENITRCKSQLLQFDFNNTVGPKSISKQELICKLNELLI